MLTGAPSGQASGWERISLKRLASNVPGEYSSNLLTAALYSAFRGVKTTIIELRDHAFALQRKCLTRWIDPTQYDWPASHWIQGIFPWVPPAMPLPWRAFPSNLIAATWTQELRSAIKKYPGLLQVKFKTKVVSATMRQPQQDLEVRYEEETVPGTFLPAVGFYGAAIFGEGSRN